MNNNTLQATEIQSISFHNQSIAVLSYQSKPYVAMKPIAENLGLDWRAQLQRIKRHQVLYKGVVIITTPSKGGEQQYTCLPLSMLNGWLFGIDANRVKPEIKDNLIRYQEECYEVLFNHFMPKVSHCLTPAQQRHIQNVVSKLANVAGNSYQAVYRSIKDHFQVGTYKDIAEEKYPALCEFLGCEPLEGDYIAHEKEQTVTLSLEDIYHLTWLLKASMRLREGVEAVTPALDTLGSSYRGSFFSMAFEYKYTIKEAKEVIIDKLKQFGLPRVFDGKNFPKLH